MVAILLYCMFKRCSYVGEGVLVDENCKNGGYFDVVMLSWLIEGFEMYF